MLVVQNLLMHDCKTHYPKIKGTLKFCGCVLAKISV